MQLKADTSIRLCISINTINEGILSIHLPFIDDSFNNTAILPKIEGADISVSGPHEDGLILAEEIKGFLCGRLKGFRDYPLILANTTSFQRHVWLTLADIPYGHALSYKDFAEILGSPNSARAVGQALGRNPFPILLPCHRVIRSDGGLGGFSSGIGWKRLLLSIESGLFYTKSPSIQIKWVNI